MLTDLLFRMRALLRRGAVERELEEEVGLHIAYQVEKYVQRGLPPQEALRRARIEFGGVDQIKEHCRDARGTRPMETMVRDLGFGVRMLRKSPVFTATALLTLALGIGANTAIFSIANALLINPYRFPEADRILSIDARHVSGRGQGAGYRDFLDWRGQNRVFDEMAIVPTGGAEGSLARAGSSARVFGAMTTPGFFRVLGLRPALGRFFAVEEDKMGAPPVAVLSYAAWQRHFDGNAEALGQTVMYQGTPHTIIGVMPRGFAFPGMRACDFWAPLRQNPLQDRGPHQYAAIARLRPGVALESAQADMAAIAGRLAAQYPQSNKDWGIRVSRLGDPLAKMAGPRVLLLFAIVFIVLLVACINIAGLQLARAVARAREMAVRAALGAGRSRIIAQVLTESILLALGGGVLGLLFACWFMGILRTAAPADAGLESILRIDALVLAFAAGLSILTGIVFGLAAAIFGSRSDLNSVLKGDAAFGSPTRTQGRFHAFLIVGEVALSLILLLSAGLLINDLQRALHIQIGLNPDHVLTLELAPPQSQDPAMSARMRLYQEVMERLRRRPDVESVAAVSQLPMTRGQRMHFFQVEGRSPAVNNAQYLGDPGFMEKMVQYNAASPGLLHTLGIPLQLGRDFHAQDHADALPVAIINDSLQKKFFPDANPVGQRFFDPYDRVWRTIVGVAGSYRHQKPTNPPMPSVFRPLAQTDFNNPKFVLRTRRDPQLVASSVRGIVRAIHPDLAVLRVRTMHEVVADSLKDSRFMTGLLSGFGGLVLLLAIIGIYGIVAYWVRQRLRELGIRMALGASPGKILRLALRKGGLLCLMGILIGMPAALAASRILISRIAGLDAPDWTVCLLVPLGLLVVSLGASGFAARRAVGIDPLTVLRSE